MKELAMEKGKREAFSEYQALQKKLQEIYKLNSTLHARIQGVRENEFKTVSVSDVQENLEEQFDMDKFDQLIGDEEEEGEGVGGEESKE